MSHLEKLNAEALAKAGFRKRADGVYTMDVSADVIGWLGLNRSTRYRPKGEVAIHPNMGVRHQEVERIVAECRGERFHQYIPATALEPLYTLLPGEQGYVSWVFDPGTDMTATARELTDAVEKYGVPFIREAGALPRLAELLQRRPSFDHHLDYRRPVVTFLLGDEEQARRDIEQTLAGIEGAAWPAAHEFRDFATEFEQHMRIGRGKNPTE